MIDIMLLQLQSKFGRVPVKIESRRGQNVDARRWKCGVVAGLRIPVRCATGLDTVLCAMQKSAATGMSATAAEPHLSLINPARTSPPQAQHPQLAIQTLTDHRYLNIYILKGGRMGVLRPRSSKISQKETQLQKAIAAHHRKQYKSLRKCADAFSVPYSTLRDRINGGRVARDVAHTEQMLLSPQQEKSVVKWIANLDNSGFPPRVDMVHTLCRQLMERQDPTKLPHIGKKFITRFLNRHPELVTKFSTQVNKQRALAFDSTVIRRCYDRLKPVMQRRNITPENTYNMDEKGILMGSAAKVKVICVRGRKQALLKQGVFI